MKRTGATVTEGTMRIPRIYGYTLYYPALPAPDELLGCILRDADGNVLASLWSIGDPDRRDGRVVEAELALEAMPGAADRVAGVVTA